MRRFNFKKIVWCCIAIVLVNVSIGSLVVHAKPSPMLSALIQEAMRCNPQIKAARDRWLAANHAIPQARALPDPMINAGYINMSGNIPGDVDPRKEQMLGGSQEIPFPGKLVVRGRIATLEAKRAVAEYQATSLTVIAQLKRIYYDLYFVNKSIDILQKNQLLLEDMEQSARTNYSVGKTPQQDVFRAQTEISRLLMRLVILRQERASLEADINRLLNRSLDIAIHTPSSLSVTSMRYDIKHFDALLKRRSPQLKMQQRNVEKGRQGVQLSKMDYFPDVEIEGGRLHDTAMHTKGYQVLLKATVPLYFMQKQNNGVRESLARYNAEIEDLHTTYQTLSFQVKNAFLLAQRSAQLIQLIQYTIIPQATLTFTSSQATYGVGKVDFLTLLNNLLTLQENELELHSEIVQHEKAITQIEETTGTFL
ncbi:TPA: TolC family protein [Legionella pneumophila]|uniref:Chemiosmotic efflux system B protein C n=1 Tax=Legionella donaldsonii TaxID=45060 RepID=A0A378J9V9_9GAMM|nr:TolC family protein [Legionella donaldsonii]STX44572.1 chemiosmotic efflux system B protein C [Legionella donaldsonii]